MALEGLEGVGGAGGLEAAVVADPGREGEAVAADGQRQEPGGGGHRSSSKGSSGGVLGAPAEEVPGAGHVLGKGGGQGEGLAGDRVGEGEGAGVQVQLAADAAAELGAPALAEVLLAAAAVLAVADDRVADGRHVGAELVGAAGDRVERHPGGAGGGGVDHRRSRWWRAWRLRWRRPRRAGRRASSRPRRPAPWPGRLDEAVADGAGARRGGAGDERPSRPCGWCATGRRAPGRRRPGSVRARRSTPEVSRSRRWTSRGLSGRPNRSASARASTWRRLWPGAALHREAGRLVERDDVVVAPDHAGLDHRGVGVGDARLAPRRAAPRRGWAARGRSGPPPAGSRGLTRPPSTRISPLRHMRSMRPWGTCG